MRCHTILLACLAVIAFVKEPHAQTVNYQWPGLTSCLQGTQTDSTGKVSCASGRHGLIASLRSANFNSTADQAIAIPSNITSFAITDIIVTNCSTSLTLAAGGFYPTTSKGGTPIVAATQVYSALTASTILLKATVAATPLITRYTVSNVYLSLTTAQGSAATCDVFLEGFDLT
jgi:hypothetical protein